MNSVQLIRPRLLRPQLSLRFQFLRRSESTTAPLKPQITPPTSPARVKKPSKYRNTRLTWLFLAFGSGLVGAGLAVGYLIPPPLAEPGSKEEKIRMADLNKKIDEEFKVKVLRGKCLGVAKQLKGMQGGWVEIVPKAIEEQAQAQAVDQNISTILQGSKGLGVQRIFWDRGEQRLVAVVWFGGSLSGWPSVTHGGMIATELVDKLALAASLAQGTSANVSDAAVPQRLPGIGNHAKMQIPTATPDEPAQLSLRYVKPTYANAFYVIRAERAVSLDRDPEYVAPGKPVDGFQEFQATLESMDAKVLVKAMAKFKAGERAQQVEPSVEDAASGVYDSLKKVLWPSRQQSMA